MGSCFSHPPGVSGPSALNVPQNKPDPVVHALPAFEAEPRNPDSSWLSSKSAKLGPQQRPGSPALWQGPS